MTNHFPKPLHQNDRLPLVFEALRNHVLQMVPDNGYRKIVLGNLNGAFQMCRMAQRVGDKPEQTESDVK